MFKNELIQFLIKIDTKRINDEVNKTGGDVLSIASNILAVVGGIGLIVSIAGYNMNKDGDTSVKPWLIGMVLSFISLTLVIGYNIYIRI